MSRFAPYLLTALLAAGVGYGLFAMSTPQSGTAPFCTGKYTHIDPDFSCDEYTESAGILQGLRSTVDQEVRQLQLNGDAKSISVWVRDLTTLQSMGINEKNLYAPASLFKVPVMIAVYKYAEIQPDILQQTITFQPSTIVPEADLAPADVRLKTGQSYTVDELISQMIRYSDNEAYEILVLRLSPAFLLNVYTDLGITLTATDTESTKIVSARSYANIFRALYQGSYLTPEYSEKALTILTQTEYRSGARVAIPASVQIAHKFGVRKEITASGTITSLKLHDCGIVYLPKHPYLYCVLTEGTNEERLNAAIATISKSIYESFAQ